MAITRSSIRQQVMKAPAKKQSKVSAIKEFEKLTKNTARKKKARRP
jgi:hypothetical protein